MGGARFALRLYEYDSGKVCDAVFPLPLPSPPLPSPPLPSSPQTSQDDMSAEDESVNRVSSMISTLLCEAATAPACERKVVSILATAVGQGHIDLDLVCKVEAGGICKVDTGSCLYIGL